VILGLVGIADVTTPFLVSLFAFKAWANRSFYEALASQPLDENRREVILALFTLDHAMRVDRVFRARLEGTPLPFGTVIAETRPDLPTLAAQVAETDAWYVDYVKGLPDTALDEVITFDFVSDQDKGRMTRGDMLAHVLTHTHSHRASVATMLEPLKIKLPSDMFTSFVSSGRQ
jgi:uncharacterized damage-inducible protein DinB